MTLRPDLVLVALPPKAEREGLIALVEDYTPPATTGIVRQVGAAVEDVTPGDVVVFGSNVGQEVEVADWPHLLIRAQDLDAVVPRA